MRLKPNDMLQGIKQSFASAMGQGGYPTAGGDTSCGGSSILAERNVWGSGMQTATYAQAHPLRFASSKCSQPLGLWAKNLFLNASSHWSSSSVTLKLLITLNEINLYRNFFQTSRGFCYRSALHWTQIFPCSPVMRRKHCSSLYLAFHLPHLTSCGCF